MWCNDDSSIRGNDRLLSIVSVVLWTTRSIVEINKLCLNITENITMWKIILLYIEGECLQKGTRLKHHRTNRQMSQCKTRHLLSTLLVQVSAVHLRCLVWSLHSLAQSTFVHSFYSQISHGRRNLALSVHKGEWIDKRLHNIGARANGSTLTRVCPTRKSSLQTFPEHQFDCWVRTQTLSEF